MPRPSSYAVFCLKKKQIQRRHRLTSIWLPVAPSFPQSRELVAAEVVVSGDVQGVGYRAFTQRAAKELGLSGWVRNLYDGRAQVEVEGPRAKVEELLARLRRGPSLGEVTDVWVTWKTPTGSAQGFTIF